MTRLHLERAFVDDAMRDRVLVEIRDGRFVSVTPDAPPDPGAERVAGLVVPGLANTHSHAFHRALRGRTQAGRGSFWTWREQMYAVAARLTPSTYARLAAATYAEMVAAGTTAVGEFHYLHHDPGGRPYPDHDMERALLAAAEEAGIRLTLLDTCYLSAGFGAPVKGVQCRYADGSVQRWAERVEALAGVVAEHPSARLGLAVHSVRAVAAADLPVVADVLARTGAVLHAHVSEQVAENEACRAAYGLTPTEVLAEHGLLTPRTTLVHATHLTDNDVALVGAAGAYVSFCPTTERDLGDGIGPAGALARAGARLSLGSDSHAVVDPYEEMRALELHERLATQERGHFAAADLLAAGTWVGHAGLDRTDAGRIAAGHLADLVVLDDRSPRLAGTGRDAASVVFAAVAEDVRRVMVGGVWHEVDRVAVGIALDEALREACP
jgi:formiminoglutamate deiminase